MTAISSALVFQTCRVGYQLLAQQLINGRWHTFFTLDLRLQPAFYLTGGQLYCREKHGVEFCLDGFRGDAAEALLDVLAKALTRFEWNKRLRAGAVGLLLGASLGAYVLTSPSPTVLLGTLGPAIERPHVNAAPAATLPLPPEDPILSPPMPAAAPVDTSAGAGDEWALPMANRSTLAENLSKAAARGLFTVPLSSGHPRTLYVFADPACPNCQRLDPALKAASAAVNVVIFPVAVIGQQQSLTDISAVLCRPVEQRAAAWEALFDPARDGLAPSQGPAAVGSPAKGQVAGTCETAQQALGVNEIAYQKYRIPGTPWVIADDGRHVPQSVIRDPSRLQAFLATDREKHDAAE